MGTNGNGKSRRIPDGRIIQLHIPIGILAIKELSFQEKHVLACLMQNVDRETGCSPALIKQTAKFLSLSDKEVADAMFELERKGLVERYPEGFVFYHHPCFDMMLEREKE